MKQYYVNIEKNCHNFELCNGTLETIGQISACLDTSKAPGFNDTYSTFLKDDTEVSAIPLRNLVNLSVKQSLSSPDQCKIAKLNPVFIEGSSSDPKNYKPISLLPAVPNIIEKTVHKEKHDPSWHAKLTFDISDHNAFYRKWNTWVLRSQSLNGFNISQTENILWHLKMSFRMMDE